MRCGSRRAKASSRFRRRRKCILAVAVHPETRRGRGSDAGGLLRRACIIRPTVMFGDGDRFLTPLRDLLVRRPVFPLFGRGMTRLQPVHVTDVAEAIAQLTGGNWT